MEHVMSTFEVDHEQYC